MRVRVRSKYKNDGWKALLKDLDYLDDQTIEYGFPYNVMHPTAKQSLPDIALWNDRGTKDKSGQFIIPPRPFLTNVGETLPFYTDRLNKQMKLALGYGTAAINRALDWTGKELVEMVVESISDGDYAALAESTVAKKKSDTILIDTGFMIDNVDFKITKNSFDGWEEG